MLLKDDEIKVKQFLKIMANIDNKIIFNEGEFPVIDPDEIKFSDDIDKDLYKNILKESNSSNLAQSSDPIPVVLSTSTATSENVNVTSPKPSTILTRSKARKALKKKDLLSNEVLTLPKNRNNKRRADEEDNNSISQEGECVKRSKVCQMPQNAWHMYIVQN